MGEVLTDLSKFFDCIPHDLVIAKLSAYNFSDEALSYIYLYRSNCIHCVHINNAHSQFKTISLVSLVAPQGSISGLSLYNLSINDIFLFLVLASFYNFADEILCQCLLPKFQDKSELESESEVIIDWFEKNKMVVNPDKFQAIILDTKVITATNN